MNRTNELAKEGKINENAGVKDQHSIIINASIEKVWDILTDLNEWPEWNKEVKKMVVDGDIAKKTNFYWTMGRYKAHSQVQQIIKPTTFSWTGKSYFVKRIYVWSLEADGNQTIVTVSTSLQGMLSVLVENHQKVYNELLNWLECLKKKTEEE